MTALTATATIAFERGVAKAVTLVCDPAPTQSCHLHLESARIAGLSLPGAKAVGFALPLLPPGFVATMRFCHGSQNIEVRPAKDEWYLGTKDRSLVFLPPSSETVTTRTIPVNVDGAYAPQTGITTVRVSAPILGKIECELKSPSGENITKRVQSFRHGSTSTFFQWVPTEVGAYQLCFHPPPGYKFTLEKTRGGVSVKDGSVVVRHHASNFPSWLATPERKRKREDEEKSAPKRQVVEVDSTVLTTIARSVASIPF